VEDEPERGVAPPADEPTADEHLAEEPSESFHRRWQSRLYLRIVAIGLLVAYGIAFVLENNKHVNLHFVFATQRVSLVWLILLSVALGLVLGVLLSQLYRRRRRRK
jgi:uncharacterized integral membrane protein